MERFMTVIGYLTVLAAVVLFAPLVIVIYRYW